MTQEEKSILIKDLSARLPYYPKCEMIDEIRVVNGEKDPSYISTLFPKHVELFSYHNNFTIKPYLRRMSSMTNEEETAYRRTWYDPLFDAATRRHTREEDLMLLAKAQHDSIMFLLENHFDFLGLIQSGLAIEVTKENNPYKD